MPILLLTGCVQAVYEEAPVVPQASPTFTPTPILSFELSPVISPTPEMLPSLYLEPSVVTLTVGEIAAVNIWLDDARRLNGVLLELSFDPDYVRVEDADPEAEGVQIAPGEMPRPVQVLENRVAEGEGWVVYQVSLEPGAAVDGSGIVASITLRGVAEGGSPLRFEHVTAFDPEGDTLELMPLSDGLIAVLGEAAVEPTPSSVTPAATEPTPLPTPSPTAQLAAGGGIYYIVQPGENLFRVGLKFGSTAQDIAAASNIADPGQVQAGTMVLIPVPPPQGGYGYYVQRRDTVYSIARRFGMTVGELTNLNDIGPDYYIEVGQILTVTP